MTVNELLNLLHSAAFMLSSGDVPLTLMKEPVNFDAELCGDADSGYYVNLIYNEK